MFLSSTALLLGCIMVVHGERRYVGRTQPPPVCPPCPYTSCSNPIQRQGECCPTCPEKDCKYNGVLYKHGETVQDYCNTCTCNNGMMECTKENCQKDCKYNGVLYKHGEKVQDYCNTCTCNNGMMDCTKENCQKDCKYNGVLYKHGEKVQDYCNTCTCNNGMMDCTKENCQKGCNYKGVPRTHGEKFKEDCNSCTCNNGQVSCTEMFCPEKPGTCPRSTGLAICLSSCSGDTSCPGDQKCCLTHCGHICMTPEPDCSSKQCPVRHCVGKYVPPGLCCHVCPRTGY